MNLNIDLEPLIDWEGVLKQPRYAGGHEEVLRAIFGDKAQVIAWWTEGDYQGTVAIAYRLPDGQILIMTDYYGSCSGCDSWEDSSEADARKMILDLVHHSRRFPNRADALYWLRNLNPQNKPYEYPFESAVNLIDQLAKPI